MSFEFRAAVRSLLLPVAPAREEEFFLAAETALMAISVNDDMPNWIAVQLRRWMTDGRPNTQFRTFVQNLLFKQDRVPVTFIFENLDGPNGEAYRHAAQSLARRFFKLQQSLIRTHLMSHDAVRQILSHAGMIVRFAIEENMTASEISRLVSARDKRFELNWRVVKAILSAAGRAPTLSVGRASEIFNDDVVAEPRLLADLNVEGSIDHIGQIAANLGCMGEFSGWLKICS